MKKLIIVALVLITGNSFGQRQPGGNPTLDSLKTERDSAAVQQKLKKLGSGTEKDMITVLNYYLDNARKKDSVTSLILRRFPKGEFAFNRQQRDLYKEENAEKREQLFKKMKQGFPDRDLDGANSAVASAYTEAKNPAKAKEYTGQIKNIATRGTAMAINAREMMQYDPAEAEALLKPEMERLLKEGIQQQTSSQGRYYAFSNLYGTILVKERKYKDALKYVVEAYEHITRRDNQMNINYGLVLSKNGRYQEALPVLQKLLDDGKANAEIKGAFAESYEKVNPGKSASGYLHTLDVALKAKRETSVAKMLINEPAPDFVVTDIHGKKVSLADFKGKTIILDFWATWCGPCKASFPSMQQVVNNYKKDPNVKFLFIHTMESAADPLSDAKRYLSTNNYTFDLYMDLKDAKTKKNAAVTAFAITGIPTKFIIDGKGNIRFKITGFFGGDDEAVAEVSAMIEIARKNS